MVNYWYPSTEDVVTDTVVDQPDQRLISIDDLSRLTRSDPQVSETGRGVDDLPKTLDLGTSTLEAEAAIDQAVNVSPATASQIGKKEKKSRKRRYDRTYEQAQPFKRPRLDFCRQPETLMSRHQLNHNINQPRK
jgi:hypothetical protein